MIMESEQRRREMSRIYNSYTLARSKYAIEDIPMPDSFEGRWVCFLQLLSLECFSCLGGQSLSCISSCYCFSGGLSGIPMPTASG